MTYHIAVFPGDGIGPEVIEQAVRVLQFFKLPLVIQEAPIGGAALEKFGNPFPPHVKYLAKYSHAILFGAVGNWKYDSLPRYLRPEQAILELRKELHLFANLRPIIVYSSLQNFSSLKKELISETNLLIVRELIGDIYFGKPRGVRDSPDGEFFGEKEGFDTMRYTSSEIRRIAHFGFQEARKRKKKICNVDKANVLETSLFWRNIINQVAKDYSDVELSHMYVDNAAMQLLKNPNQFDVILTGNLFGDILSDEASMLTGSIGVLPSASINEFGKGLYEPIHGSALDIAGKGIANPVAAILSVSMLLRYSLHLEYYAKKIEYAVNKVLEDGFCTEDLYKEKECMIKLSTNEIGNKILFYLNEFIK